MRKPPNQRAECHPDQKNHAGGFCRSCYNKEYARTHTRDRQKRREANKRWAQRYPNHYKNPTVKRRIRERVLPKRFGITIERYEEIFTAQHGVCQICGRRPKEQNLDVDHDHKTGAVRGLLCRICNSALGYFDDDPQRFRRAAEYLESNKDWRINAGTTFVPRASGSICNPNCSDSGIPRSTENQQAAESLLARTDKLVSSKVNEQTEVEVNINGESWADTAAAIAATTLLPDDHWSV